jgi:hypothetical protein
MQKIKDHLNLNPTKLKSGEIGIEVEIEGGHLCSPPSSSVWKGTQDTSLRGESLEYVLKEPLSPEGALASVDELNTMLRQSGATIHDSIRAGVHVHKNVQQYNIIQLYNLIVTWLIFDEVMATFAGETREGNLFCLRATDAEYLIAMLKTAAEENDLRYLTTDEIRYASINLASLSKFGSVEFRLMRTPTDVMEVKPWVELILKIVEFAESFSTPQHIVTSFSEINYTNFCRTCFGDKFSLLQNIPNLSEKTKRGMRLAQEVAFSIDWGSLIVKMDKNIFSAVSTEVSTIKIKPKKIGQKYSGQAVPRKKGVYAQVRESMNYSIPREYTSTMIRAEPQDVEVPTVSVAPRVTTSADVERAYAALRTIRPAPPAPTPRPRATRSSMFESEDDNF